MNRLLWTLLLGTPSLLWGQLPGVSFDTTATRVSESASSTFVWLRVDGPVSQTTSVELEVHPASTAEWGVDFVIPNGDVLFQPGGPDSMPVEILILDDSQLQNGKYLVLDLVNYSGLSPGEYSRHVVLIDDDDRAYQHPASAYQLEHITSIRLDTLSNVVAKIAAYDPESKRVFVSNNAQNTIEILDLSDPAAPQKVLRLALSPWGGNVNSVACYNGVFAVPIEAIPYTEPGRLVFFDPDGNYLNDVFVGAFPKMVCFTPDGNWVLVANEGRPWDDYSIDPPGSISVVSLQGGVGNVNQGSVQTITFEQFDGQESFLRSQGIRIFGPGASASDDLEPEYIAVSPDGQKAYVGLQENNALAVVNLISLQIEELRSFGRKDWELDGAGMDASDLATGRFFNPWPVYSFYQPDGLATFQQNGNSYLFGACEGEIREYNALNEDKRVGDSLYVLDSNAFPDAEVLKHEALLGRLHATTLDGDTDGDGDFDEINAFGGRSIAIWNAQTGELIWESGDELEFIVSEHPDYQSLFNVNFNNLRYQNRSDDKGPEPEDVEIAEMEDGSRIGFVSLERTGGVMMYELNDPESPQFLQYINTRAVDTISGDRGTEGLLFIPKTESPNGRHLLLSCNEASGTLAIYEMSVDKTQTGEYRKDTFLLNTGQIGIYNGFSVFEGGISGLTWYKEQWKMLSDRGPALPAYNSPFANGQNAAVFPFPSYSSKLWTFSEDSTTLTVQNLQTFRKPDNAALRGIPPPSGFGGTGEVPWATANGVTLNTDFWGMDPEGMAIDNQGNTWLADEYGSAFWQFNDQLIAQKRFTAFPFQTIDESINPILQNRSPNAGLAGLAYTPNGTLYSITQRPLSNPDTTTGNTSTIHRVVALNPETGQITAYAIIGEEGASFGDVTAINNSELLVVEYLERGTQIERKLYRISLGPATPILIEDFNGQSLEQLMDAAGLAQNGITPVEKTLWLDLGELDWNPNLKHPEGLFVLNDTTVALINDNSYGIFSPNADGNASASFEPTVLYKYTVPNEKALNYINPYCDVEIGDTLVGCTNGSVLLTVEGQGFVSAEWSNGQNGLNTDVFQAGWQWVEAENVHGCKARDSVFLVFDAVLPVSLGADTSICPGNNISLSAAQQGADSYLWSNGFTGPDLMVSQPGQYSVTVSSTAGCTGTDQITIGLASAPQPELGLDRQLCPGQFTVIGDEEPGWLYTWSNGAASAFILAEEAGVFTVTVTDENGCTGTDFVTVEALPVPQVDLGPDQPLCNNVSIQLDAGDAGVMYWWSTGENTQTIEAEAGGSYSVTVSNSFGCEGSDDITLFAVAAPNFDLGTDTTICQGDTISLVVDAPGLYQWNTGSTEHSIDIGTEGIYWLQVFNSFGCSAIDSVFVDVVICTGVEHASGSDITISPNPGTGLFYIQNAGKGIESIQVFNAAGELILKSKQNSTIDIRHSPAGYYQVHLGLSDGRELHFRVLKI